MYITIQKYQGYTDLGYNVLLRSYGDGDGN